MGAINHLATVVAAVVYFALGAIWYNVFAAAWLAAVGKTMEQAQKDAPGAMPYVVGFIAILVAVYTLAWLAQRLSITTAVDGIKLGITVGLGLVGASLALHYGFEGRPATLLLINAGYAVVGLGVSGAIIGGWKKKAAA